jgi:hypothetical protein
LVSLLLKCREYHQSVIKLEPLPAGDVNRSTAVGAALLLVLLLGEALAAGDREILPSPLGVRVRDIIIGDVVIGTGEFAEGRERGRAGTRVLLLVSISGGRAGA